MKTYRTKRVCCDCRHRGFVPTENLGCPACRSTNIFEANYRVRIPPKRAGRQEWRKFCDRFGGNQLQAVKEQAAGDTALAAALKASAKSPHAFEAHIANVYISLKQAMLLSRTLLETGRHEAFIRLMAHCPGMLGLCMFAPPPAVGPEADDPVFGQGGIAIPWDQTLMHAALKRAQGRTDWEQRLWGRAIPTVLAALESHPERFRPLTAEMGTYVRSRFLAALSMDLLLAATPEGPSPLCGWFRANIKLFNIGPLRAHAESRLGEIPYWQYPKQAGALLRNTVKLIGPIPSERLRTHWCRAIETGALTGHEYLEYFGTA